ncbi:MAG: Ig-like domain-containing protein [Euryarchaeota archaeon]|nr:Ig-like domain-containing protein [Euryarchaeota archaeon]
MTKRLITKAVVLCIICLFFGTSAIANRTEGVPIKEQVAEEPQSIGQMSNQNSVICGYITDNVTGDPLGDVEVGLSWEDFEGNTGWNTTYTDSTGFYLFITVPVEFRLQFYPENYFNEYSSTLTVWENQIFWFNISLIPIPEQTARIQGYLTDSISGEPIQSAIVTLNWYEEGTHYWYNYTYSNSSGYYYIGSIPGRVIIYVHYDNYFSYDSGDLFIQNNSLIWFNISLIPYPTASAFVCGYITDAELGDPIPNAQVDVSCYTEYGYFSNITYTDEIGFYTLGTIPGNIDIWYHCQDYESSSSQNHEVKENETLWINLTMTYHPTEDSEVKGYVIDGQTHAAVRNAFIRYDWRDEVGHYYSKSTFTDQKGYYLITAPAGLVQFFITGNGYTTQQTSWFTIYEYSESWLNVTVEPEISLVFDKPQPGIYINNELRFPLFSRILSRFFPKSIPLIIGPLDITVNITKSTLGCNRVEFYIDNEYLGTDTEEPFTYYWNEKGFSKHTIQVLAYDNAGPCRIETIIVRKLM